jgi:hypothetical protein
LTTLFVVQMGRPASVSLNASGRKVGREPARRTAQSSRAKNDSPSLEFLVKIERNFEIRTLCRKERRKGCGTLKS